MPLRSWGMALLLSLASVMSASCQGDRRHALHSVHGQVTFQKKPASSVVVVLRPVNRDVTYPTPSGTVGPDGKFVIGTYAIGDGVPVGEYVVTMTWTQMVTDANGDQQSRDRLGGRYADPLKSQWKIAIREGDNDLGQFHLQ